MTDVPEPHGFGRAIVAGDLVLAPSSDGVLRPPRQDLVSRGWWKLGSMTQQPVRGRDVAI